MMRNTILFLFVLITVSACKSPEARQPIQRTSGSFIQESIARNKKLIAQEEAVIEQIMKRDTVNTYFASENGFWYYYQVRDTLSTTFPKLGDHVVFSYDVKRLNGAPILSETEENYRVDKSNQELISGIRDGIKLMKAGETVTFLFPSHKAYGYYGIIDKLETNVPVQSTITLKSINSSNTN